MTTKHPRLNVVRDLIREALESYEDIHWAKVAESRKKTFSKKTALIHKQIWG